jgi:dTDP-3-amino-3,4,6-trideoxy-alpha-D-glucopyranose N,N-dimethyltransferase
MFSETAHVYDLIYDAIGKDYAGESSEIKAMLDRRNPGARTLLDVACGTGGHLRYLKDHYEVTGVDLDPAMIEAARHRLDRTPLVVGDMRSLDLGRTFDAVICLFSSIGYLADEGELETAVRSMAGHLNPKGVLIVDGWVRPDSWLDGGHVSVDTAVDDTGLQVVRVVRSERSGEKTLLEMQYLIATGERIEHVTEVHELTLFAPEAYETALEAAGLEVEVVESPMPGRDRYVGTVPS